MADRMSEIFNSFQDYLNNEEESREEILVIVKVLEKNARDILMILQNIHNENNVEENIIVSQHCAKARELFENVRTNYARLADIVPRDQYYRFHDKWRFVTQKLCFLASLIVYLEIKVLVSKETVADMLGGPSNSNQKLPKTLSENLIKRESHKREIILNIRNLKKNLIQTQEEVVFRIGLLVFNTNSFVFLHTKCMYIAHVVKNNRKDGFHLDLEDFLMGLLQLAAELSRFAMNSVTNGDYNQPIEIARFINELNAGFRLLNLKNDALRKRFDGLKYAVKKVEEVVYDLSIRGLKPSSNSGTEETNKVTCNVLRLRDAFKKLRDYFYETEKWGQVQMGITLTKMVVLIKLKSRLKA